MLRVHQNNGKFNIVAALSLILLMIKQILSLKAVETSTARHTKGCTQTLDYYFPPTKTMIQPSVAS